MKNLSRGFLLIVVYVCAGMGQTGEPMNVERLFATPSLGGVDVSNMQWAPDGSALAYLRRDADGVVNDLWLYERATGTKRRLARAADLLAGEQTFSREEEMLRERTRQSGIGITRYFWSPDARTVFVPLSGDIYTVDAASARVARLTSTPAAEYDPKIAPPGDLLAYVREGEIFVMNLQTRAETQLTRDATEKIRNGISEFVAQEEMDRTSGYWWSPDGKQIAYLQIDNTPVKEFFIPQFLEAYSQAEKQEYPKAGEANTLVRIGVVQATGGPTSFLDLGMDTDIYIARVDWLPDSKRLAVQRQSRNQDTLDLLFYDLQRGSMTRILREVNPRWVSLHDDLRFLPTRNQFLWSSERSGFNHLYLYDMTGRLVRQVTNGAWDVGKVVAVDAKGGTAYFTATEKSAMERHLYRIRLDGSGFTRLTTAEGWHDIAAAPDFMHFADKHSRADRPPSLVLLGAEQKAAILVEDNPPTELLRYVLPSPEFFSIKTSEGIALHALMIKPSTFDPRRIYPVIVYVYGGPTSQVVANMWGAGGGMARALWHRMMAEKGYLVFMVDGRGTPGRGRAFQDVVHRRLGHYEVLDQLAGVEYLQTLPYVDTSRIMIWGKSYGGYMTLMTLFTAGEPFKLGIALAPVVDWRNYDTHYTERYLEHPAVNAEGYTWSSPLHHVQGLMARLLLVHGVVDDNVHFQESMLLADELQKANKQFDFMPYPRSTHAFGGKDVGMHLYNLLTRYIQDNL